MKVLVFSDSRGDLSNMSAAIGWERPDFIIHLGNKVIDAQMLSRQFPDLPIAWTRKNIRDGWDFGDADDRVTLDHVRFYLRPAYEFDVGMLRLPRVYSDLKKKADVLLFVPDSKAFVRKVNEAYVMNPGFCSCRRAPSYGFFELSQGEVKDWGIRYFK